MLTRDDQAWFFKTQASIGALEPHADTFREFIKSLEFREDRPVWSLPADWSEQAGGGMRIATLSFGDPSTPIELSVIPLPVIGDNERQYVLSNVNRWRGQLALPPLSIDELDGATETIETAAGAAIVADMTGWSSGSMAPTGPFSEGTGTTSAPHPPASTQRQNSSSAGGSSPIEYETPEGWKTLPASGMRVAAFSVGEGEQAAEITVIPLGPQAGSLLDNINRWRQQIELAPIKSDELAASVSEIDVGDDQGQYAELIGSNERANGQAIFAVAVETTNRTWFIKMMGAQSTVERQRDHFRAFASSIRFND